MVLWSLEAWCSEAKASARAERPESRNRGFPRISVCCTKTRTADRSESRQMLLSFRDAVQIGEIAELYWNRA